MTCPVETSIVTMASVSIAGWSAAVPALARRSADAHQVFGESGPQVWVVFPLIQRIRARRDVDVLPSVDVSRAAAAADLRVWSDVWSDAQAIASNM
jgi:hypothetical protein